MYCNPTPDGSEYLGRVSVTETGRQCQEWSAQAPHTHSYTQDSMFPDATVKAAVNYCRNPSASGSSLWCFTTDVNIEREPCDVHSCSEYRQ